jgi:hypothetical protein
VGSPETASAVVTADGPGTAVTRTPAATAAATTRYPGSLMPGIPASVTTSTFRPAASSAANCSARRDSITS